MSIYMLTQEPPCNNQSGQENINISPRYEHCDAHTRVIISAVKRLKYLNAINRIYVIVNSKLIAINRKFVSILNYFYFNALINMEKWIGLLYANVIFD